MTKKRLYAHLILDRSGSMKPSQQSTIKAVNDYVQGLAKDDTISSRISISVFHSEAPGDTMVLNHPVDNVKARKAPALDTKSYSPDGGTPLNDAIGHVVNQVKGRTRREEENVALVIVSDGQENASKEFGDQQIKDLLAEVQRNGWLVIYLGANQDTQTEGVLRKGTAFANTADFYIDNMAETMDVSLAATSRYAATGLAESASFTTAERSRMKDGTQAGK